MYVTTESEERRMVQRRFQGKVDTETLLGRALRSGGLLARPGKGGGGFSSET